MITLQYNNKEITIDLHKHLETLSGDVFDDKMSSEPWIIKSSDYLLLINDIYGYKNTQDDTYDISQYQIAVLLK